MLRSSIPAALCLAAAAAPALSSDLEVRVESSGASAVTAAPGSTLPLSVVGELCDADNLGLAAVSLDLAYSGGVLTPFPEPTAAPLESFASPLGLANPAGFGGTPIDGDLIQVGGAQNTLNQGFAPQPTGSVVIAVAHPGAPVTLGTGQITVPNQPGVYTVEVVESKANVIAPGATGSPFWEVEPAGVQSTPLEITVAPTLTVDVTSLSVSAGGTAALTLDAGPVHGGRPYLLLGSVTGTAPATPFGGLSVPLVLDPYTLLTLGNPGTPPLSGGLGLLDAQGRANAAFTVPAAADPALAALSFHHAYLLLLPEIDFVSNAASFALEP